MKYVLINTFQHILTQHYFINIALFLRSPVSTVISLYIFAVCLILFEGITKDLIHLFPYFWFVSSISSEPNILWWKSNVHVWKKSEFSPLLLSLLDFHMKSSDPVETLERLIEILLLQGRRKVKNQGASGTVVGIISPLVGICKEWGRGRSWVSLSFMKFC